MSGNASSRGLHPDRIAAALIVPFVVLWDAGQSVMFGYFALAERMDPFAFAWRVMKRLARPVVWLWNAILSTVIAISHAVGARFMAGFQRVATVLAPLLRRLSPVLDAVERHVKRLIGWLVAAARRN